MKCLILAGCIVLANPIAALAQIINGDDIILTDLSPTIAYDDTDSVGYNWVVRGDDFGYSIFDEEASKTLLFIHPDKLSVAIGYESTANGTWATALGRFASATGNQGTSLGYSAYANGAASIAIGYAAGSTGTAGTALGYAAGAIGNFSNALGYLAQASSATSTAIGSYSKSEQANAIVLGSIPGVNSGTEYADVGIGTTMPASPLHVRRNDGTAQILVEDTDNEPLARTLFRIASAGSNAKFEIDNTSTGVSWAFTNSGTDFRISKQGSGVVELLVANNGNATLAGALTQNSDRNAKQAIVPVNVETVLEKVTALTISQWQYRDETGVNHVGPMAQDFHAAFGLGVSDTGISSIDTAGVALAAIQALVVRNRELESRVAQMEAMLTELLPRVALSP